MVWPEAFHRLSEGDQEGSTPHRSLSVSCESQLLVAACSREMKPGSSEQQYVPRKVIDPKGCNAMSLCSFQATESNQFHFSLVPPSGGHHVKAFTTHVVQGSIIIPTLEKGMLRLRNGLSVTETLAAIRIHTFPAELGIKPVAEELLENTATS